jgi:phosphatidylglycerophosphate synthase
MTRSLLPERDQDKDLPMPPLIYVHIVGASETTIWGLTGCERLKRMLQPFKHVSLVANPDQIPAHALALLLRADHLFDSRVLAWLISAQTDLVFCTDKGQCVGVRIAGGEARSALDDFLSGGEGPVISSLPRCTLKDLDLLDIRQKLKKRDPPYVLPIRTDNRQTLEAELFTRSYKGVTDLVTKWLWPLPAFWVVRFCVRFGLKPNQVTVVSLVFAVAAGVAFWHSYYGWGLLLGWLMTFLDTVDGKLARVTVTSSRFGDVLDHGLDIIHPPLWYIAWGVGLTATSVAGVDLPLLCWLILIGYVGGRICEGAFQFWIASFDIFIWRPLDSFNRLITARRNPNLILLTFSWLLDRPDLGLFSVIAWHLLSTVFLAVRVMMGWQARRSDGPLQSWFEEIVPGQDDGKLAIRIFAPLTVKVDDRKVTGG